MLKITIDTLHKLNTTK